MGKTLRKLFNLYPGEEKKALLFALLGFLWAVGAYGTLTLSEGMFLEHIGAEGLPTAYLVMALGMCTASSFLLFALNRLRIYALLVSVLALGISAVASLAVVLAFFPQGDSTIFWYAMKIIGWVLPVSTYIAFWAFVDQYYDLQDAKRLFCLFNSTIFLGDAFAGGTISLILDHVGVPILLTFFGMTIAASIPCLFFIMRRVKPVLEEHQEGIETKTSRRFKDLFSSIIQSPFTIALLLFYFLMQLLVITTEFSYMENFGRHFEGREYALTEFLGTLAMFISLGNMIFGLLFYSRIVKRIGVNNIILIAPTFFLGVFMGWFYTEALYIAIFGFIAREGIAYALDDNNLNLLISGVPPKVKNQVRITVESFFEPIGMLMASLLLFSLHDHSLVLGTILSLVALGLVLYLRKTYPGAIFKTLTESALRFEKKTLDWLKSFSKREQKEVERLLIAHLTRKDELIKLLAYESLLLIGSERLLPRLLNQFGRLSIQGKLKAIDLLGKSRFAKETIVVEHLERLRQQFPNPQVKSAIHFYFAKHATLRPERLSGDLQSEHLGLRGAAILALKTRLKDLIESVKAEEHLNALLHSSHPQELCMGIRILGLEKNGENIQKLMPFLTHETLEAQKEASLAIAELASPALKQYAFPLLNHLCQMRDLEIRAHCLTAIEKFEEKEIIYPLFLASHLFRPSERKKVEAIVAPFGKEIIPLMLSIAQESTLPLKSRLLAAKMLGKLSLTTLKSHLPSIIRPEIEEAYFYYYHAHTLQSQGTTHDLSLLQNALHNAYQSHLDFAVQLLGLGGSIEDPEILTMTLKSKNRKTKAAALETLEKASPPSLFERLRPLIEDFSSDERLRHYTKKTATLKDLLDLLLASSSRGDQIVASTLKSQLHPEVL